jgi:hypothetical protein
MKEQMKEQITALIPAPGWKALGCGIRDDGTVFYWEAPAVGWGVVRTKPEYGEVFDEIQLFVFDECVHTVSEGEGCNTAMIEVPPGTIITDVQRAQMERSVRSKMKDRKDFRAKRERELAEAK